VSPFDNALAVDQMEVAYSTLLRRQLANPERANPKLSSVKHPRIIRFVPSCQFLRGHHSDVISSLGGDHTIVCLSWAKF
jgi:hypothetical protein